VPGGIPAEGAVRGQPLQLDSRRAANRAVAFEEFDYFVAEYLWRVAHGESNI
jgi:hypothetical protein